MTDLGSRISTLGLTQAEFAGLIGVSIRAIQRWGAGDFMPPIAQRMLALMEFVPDVMPGLRAIVDGYSPAPVDKDRIISDLTDWNARLAARVEALEDERDGWGPATPGRMLSRGARSCGL